jgi:hypothetical protein
MLKLLTAVALFVAAGAARTITVSKRAIFCTIISAYGALIGHQRLSVHSLVRGIITAGVIIEN